MQWHIQFLSKCTTEKSAFICKDSKYWIFFNLKGKFWHTWHEVAGLPSNYHNSTRLEFSVHSFNLES